MGLRCWIGGDVGGGCVDFEVDFLWFCGKLFSVYFAVSVQKDLVLLNISYARVSLVLSAPRASFGIGFKKHRKGLFSVFFVDFLRKFSTEF